MNIPRLQQQLVGHLQDARQRTLALLHGLDSAQLMGPRLATVNPLLWEIGHVAYFHEFWLLRQRHGHSPLRADADQLFDSINIHHDSRWDLPLPDLEDTLAYRFSSMLVSERKFCIPVFIWGTAIFRKRRFCTGNKRAKYRYCII